MFKKSSKHNKKRPWEKRRDYKTMKLKNSRLSNSFSVIINIVWKESFIFIIVRMSLIFKSARKDKINKFSLSTSLITYLNGSWLLDTNITLHHMARNYYSAGSREQTTASTSKWFNKTESVHEQQSKANKTSQWKAQKNQVQEFMYRLCEL